MLGWRKEGELGVNSASLVTPPSTFLFFVFSPLVHQVYTAFCNLIVCCVLCFYSDFVDANGHNAEAHLQITDVGLPCIKSICNFTISTLLIIYQVD